MTTITTHLPNTTVSKHQTLDTWIKHAFKHYHPDEQIQLEQSCILAETTVPRRDVLTGETQLRHNLATAEILAQLNMDIETIQAAMLQGVIDENEGLNPARLEQITNRAIAGLVASLARINILGVLPLTAAEPREKQLQAEGIRRLLLGMVDDVRAVLILLASRLRMLRIAKQLPEETRRYLALETQRLYAPLANRLGIWQIKWELEDLSLRFLEPIEYKRIAELLDGKRTNREQYLQQVMATLKTHLAEVGIKASITGRPKHIYSIWRKMTRKKVNFDQIFDVRAVRVLVETVADCYAALGITHGLWQHIPGEFDDYITTPKANLYQSIHTAVEGPEGKPVEIQIRTVAMHQHAELGVAAHWRYKENAGHNQELERRILWMRHWLERKTEGTDSEETEENIKDLHADFKSAQVYVLTPKNQVIELPTGATPLDFAYAIHSEVGHACRGARVNGRLVPITQALESGQTIEILTVKHGAPSRDWLSPHLGYVHTNQARNKIRHWFRQQDFAQYLTAGKSMLDKEIIRFGIKHPINLEKLAIHFNYKNTDDLYAALGRNDITINQVINHIEREITQPEPPAPVIATHAPVYVDTGRGAIVVEGVGNLMTSMAGCCKPVPYDYIIGFITIGRGITVHRHNCSNILKLPEPQQTRLIQVRWSNQPVTGNFSVDMLITAEDRKGLLRDLFAVVAGEDVNVLGVNSVSYRDTDTAKLRFTLEIKDMQQFNRVLTKVLQVPKILEARRYI